RAVRRAGTEVLTRHTTREVAQPAAADVPDTRSLGARDDEGRRRHAASDIALAVCEDPIGGAGALLHGHRPGDYHCAMRRVPAETSRNARQSVAVATKCAASGPNCVERAEAQLTVEVEPCGVDALHVLLAMRGDERVVRVGRFPAVDHEISGWRLDVAQELRADVATAAAEELCPLAVRP